MDNISYGITDLFAVFMLLLIWLGYGRQRQGAFLSDQRLFETMLLVTSGILVLDIGTWLLNGAPGPTAALFNHIVTLLYYSLNPVVGLLYYGYSECKLEVPERRRRRMAFGLIPVGFNLILSVVSLFVPALFWLDEANFYQRGPLFALSMVFSYIPVVAALLEILLRVRREGVKFGRSSIYYSLALFPVFPLAGGALQVLLPGVSVVWPSSALSLLVVFIKTQNVQITTDALTGLYNRRQLMPYLEWKTHRLRAGMQLYLVLLDLDHFKQINDTCGHLVGDSALMQAAGILKDCVRREDFVGRYGGDEFIVVAERRGADQVEELLNVIGRRMEQFNAGSSAGYRLSVSAGYAAWADYAPDTDAFISAADARMYYEKFNGAGHGSPPDIVTAGADRVQKVRI